MAKHLQLEDAATNENAPAPRCTDFALAITARHAYRQVLWPLIILCSAAWAAELFNILLELVISYPPDHQCTLSVFARVHITWQPGDCMFETLPFLAITVL